MPWSVCGLPAASSAPRPALVGSFVCAAVRGPGHPAGHDPTADLQRSATAPGASCTACDGQLVERPLLVEEGGSFLPAATRITLGAGALAGHLDQRMEPSGHG